MGSTISQLQIEYVPTPTKQNYPTRAARPKIIFLFSYLCAFYI